MNYELNEADQITERNLHRFTQLFRELYGFPVPFAERVRFCELPIPAQQVLVQHLEDSV